MKSYEINFWKSFDRKKLSFYTSFLFQPCLNPIKAGGAVCCPSLEEALENRYSDEMHVQNNVEINA